MIQWSHDHEGWASGDMLGALARADAAQLKTFADPLIAHLGEIEVIENRTGLVMLPMRDTAQGTHFHLGEILMSEARISVDGIEGYGMRRGRDLEAAMAMAVVDLAIAVGTERAACLAFVQSQIRTQENQDHAILCKVEATRVNMETF